MSDDDDPPLQSSGRKQFKSFLSELGLSSTGLNALGASSSDDEELSDDSDIVELDLDDETNRIAGTSDCGLDFRVHAVSRAFRAGPSELSAIHADCEACFKKEGSFWMAAGAVPRCTLERLAKHVFEHHTRNAQFDPTNSGAEWWVQIRECGGDTGGIGFHWDQDEDLLDSTGLSLCPPSVHCHLPLGLWCAHSDMRYSFPTPIGGHGKAILH